jgi:hypothetical protein
MCEAFVAGHRCQVPMGSTDSDRQDDLGGRSWPCPCSMKRCCAASGDFCPPPHAYHTTNTGFSLRRGACLPSRRAGVLNCHARQGRVVDIEQTRHQVFIEGDGDGNVHQVGDARFQTARLELLRDFLARLNSWISLRSGSFGRLIGGCPGTLGSRTMRCCGTKSW